LFISINYSNFEFMFKGDKSKGDIESPDRLNRLVSGTKVIGDLVAESNLRVDGVIEGNVSCKGKFVLGTDGQLVGNLVSAESEIEGTVEGDLRVEGLLVLRKTAVIKGALASGRLVIEDGAQLQGSVSSGDLPKVKSIHTKPAADKETPMPQADVVY